MKAFLRLFDLFGTCLQWFIHLWIRATGKSVSLEEHPWLEGPIGGRRIGADFYEEYAASAGLKLIRSDPEAGLVQDFDDLTGPTFNAAESHPAVRDFYEHTAQYSMDVWSQWSGPMQPFARILIAAVSSKMEQLNLPLSPIDTSRGMTSEVIRLVDAQTGELRYTGWLRRTEASGAVIYVGFYTQCVPPGHDGPVVKVVFPLPGGSSTVLLRAENQPDGSFKLISDGQEFGNVGYYRLHKVGKNRIRVKYLPLKEVIHVYEDKQGVLRTDHTFGFAGMKLLTLHYKINRKSPPTLPSP